VLDDSLRPPTGGSQARRRIVSPSPREPTRRQAGDRSRQPTPAAQRDQGRHRDPRDAPPRGRATVFVSQASSGSDGGNKVATEATGIRDKSTLEKSNGNFLLPGEKPNRRQPTGVPNGSS